MRSMFTLAFAGRYAPPPFRAAVNVCLNRHNAHIYHGTRPVISLSDPLPPFIFDMHELHPGAVPQSDAGRWTLLRIEISARQVIC